MMVNIMEFLKNIITSSTNMAAICPLYFTIKAGDKHTSYCIIYAALSSAISHLFESHKHGLYGFGMSARYSYYLNKCDVLGAILLVARIFYILYLRFNRVSITQIFCIGSAALIFLACNLISEMDTSRETQNTFLIFHNIWHMGIFLTLGYLLSILY